MTLIVKWPFVLAFLMMEFSKKDFIRSGMTAMISIFIGNTGLQIVN